MARLIEGIHLASKGTYGSPRIHAALINQGQRCSRQKVERLMRKYGIRAKTKRRYKATTNSKHNLPVAPNTLNRQFNPKKQNKAWAGDITYIRTKEGWLYLSVVLDLFSRRVVGWAMDRTIDTQLTVDALKMALRGRKTPGDNQMLFHSDRGSQYASKAFQGKLDDYEIECSMSRKGDCWDNSVVESFFGTLKQEHVSFFSYETRKEATSSIFEWIEGFYNSQRLHSTLGFLSPAMYEDKFNLA